MSSNRWNDPKIRAAIETCAAALRPLAEFQLEPEIDAHMLQLGERKDLFSSWESKQLHALLAFTQLRTIEKLEAQAALKQWHDAFPELASPE